MLNFELMIDSECGAKLFSPRKSILNGDFISVGMISFDREYPTSRQFQGRIICTSELC